MITVGNHLLYLSSSLPFFDVIWCFPPAPLSTSWVPSAYPTLTRYSAYPTMSYWSRYWCTSYYELCTYLLLVLLFCTIALLTSSLFCYCSLLAPLCCYNELTHWWTTTISIPSSLPYRCLIVIALISINNPTYSHCTYLSAYRCPYLCALISRW